MTDWEPKFLILNFKNSRNFQGHPRLVGTLAELYSDLLKQAIDPMKEVLITVGAYHALFYSVFGLINPGDEVNYGQVEQGRSLEGGGETLS